MKQKILTILAAVAIILGMGSCTTNDNPTTPSVDVNNLEKELVGLWWDEYEYADVTEDGVPFTRVLLAVRANADHTGCIYLGVFDDQGDEPLAVYGGPEEAGFKWQLKADGTIVLTDPASGESISMARTRGEGGSYGKDMTNVANTSATYTSGNVTVTNGSYSGILEKADAGKAADIENTLSKQSTAISAASEDGTIGKYTDKNGVEREGIVVTLDGKKYLIAMSNETANASITSGSSFYTFADAVKHFTDDSENGKEDYSDSHVWRLPTEAEIGYLAGIPNKAWDRANKGYKWTFGSSSASLLLPAAGFWSDLVYKVGWQGSYWSSTPSRLYRDYAYVLYFDEDGVKVYNSNRKHGDSVRLFCQLYLTSSAADGTVGHYKDANNVDREGVVVTINGKKYAIATSHETTLPDSPEKNTRTSDNFTYYTWNDACKLFANGKTDGSYTAAGVWRLPTKKEMEGFAFTYTYPNGWDATNKGYKFTIGSYSLILPVAGYYRYEENDNLVNVGENGRCWTSTRYSEGGAYYLNFYSDYNACSVYSARIKDGNCVRLFCQLP